jgi:hypothetical protein
MQQAKIPEVLITRLRFQSPPGQQPPEVTLFQVIKADSILRVILALDAGTLGPLRCLPFYSNTLFHTIDVE